MNRKQSAWVVTAALCGAATMLGGGCEVYNTTKEVVQGGKELVSGSNKNWEEKRDSVFDEPVPIAQLESVVDKAVDWVVETAPNLSKTKESKKQLVFVVGAIRNTGGGLADEVAASEAREVFRRLQTYSQMRRNFIFIDRSSDATIDIGNLTGDPDDYLDNGNGGVDEYFPEDILLLSMEFTKTDDKNVDPPRRDFSLTVSIDWGGNKGQSLASEVFSKTVLFDMSTWSQLTGGSGYWKDAE